MKIFHKFLQLSWAVTYEPAFRKLEQTIVLKKDEISQMKDRKTDKKTSKDLTRGSVPAWEQ